jgi:4-aminobutyrate aminotransferase
MAKAWPGSQGGTYGGNAVSCAAAVATLDVIQDESLVENAAARGRQLLDGARLVGDKTPAIGDVRGLGLLVGSEFTKPDGEADTATAQAAQKAAAERGLLLLTCGAYMNVVRMIPPLIVDADQVDEALRIWADVVASVTGS